MIKHLIVLMCMVLAPITEGGDSHCKSNKKSTYLYIQQLRNNSVGDPDPRVGDALRGWTRNSMIKPHEVGYSYLEGDLLITTKGPTRALKLQHFWPKGIVYYRITGPFSPGEVRVIRETIRHIEKRTKCINFRPFTGKEGDYISITNRPTGCWSGLGRVGGMQELNLQTPQCINSDDDSGYVLVHLLGHSLGLPHEHARADRDDKISVVWENIVPGYERQFKKSHNYKINVPYSYDSIMHFSARAFSRNGLPTIKAKKFSLDLGYGRELNRCDVAKIRTLYKCKGRKSSIK